MVGYKWFCLVLMCDVFFILVYIDKGLICFLLLCYWLDGSCN